MINGALRQVGALLQPVRTRITNLVARGVVRLIADGYKMQLVQVEGAAGEPIEGQNGVEHFQPFGLSAVPLEGAEAVVLFVAGDRSHPIALTVADRRYRPLAAEPGTVTLHNHVTGCRITMRADGDVEITPAAGGQVFIRDGSGGAAIPTKATLEALRSAILGWVPVSGDGGAALKTALTALFGTGPAWSWPTTTTVLIAE